MARKVARSEIWMYRFSAPDKRRPVLVLSRPALLEVLHTTTVAAITTTVRGIPTEVTLGVEEGLKGPSCANLVNVFSVQQADLVQYVGAVSEKKMRAVCEALSIAVGCDR